MSAGRIAIDLAPRLTRPAAISRSGGAIPGDNSPSVQEPDRSRETPLTEFGTGELLACGLASNEAGPLAVHPRLRITAWGVLNWLAAGMTAQITRRGEALVVAQTTLSPVHRIRRPCFSDKFAICTTSAA